MCDVDVAFCAEGVDGEVAKRGHGSGRVAGADLTVVFVEGRVTDVMGSVFDAPMSSLVDGDVGRSGGVGGQAGDAVDDLFGGALAVEAAAVAHGAKYLRGVREIDTVGGGQTYGAVFGAAVSTIDAVVAAVGHSVSVPASSGVTAASRLAWLAFSVSR